MESISNLRAALEKMKDKEIKLEADLAIKLNPELEQAIIEIMIQYNEVKQLREKMNSQNKPEDSQIELTIKQLKAQVAYYKNRLESAQEVLSNYLQGKHKMFFKARDNLGEEVEKLQILVDSWRSKLDGVDMKVFVPSVFDFVE